MSRAHKPPGEYQRRLYIIPAAIANVRKFFPDLALDEENHVTNTVDAETISSMRKPGRTLRVLDEGNPTLAVRYEGGRFDQTVAILKPQRTAGYELQPLIMIAMITLTAARGSLVSGRWRVVPNEPSLDKAIQKLGVAQPAQSWPGIWEPLPAVPAAPPHFAPVREIAPASPRARQPSPPVEDPGEDVALLTYAREPQPASLHAEILPCQHAAARAAQLSADPSLVMLDFHGSRLAWKLLRKEISGGGSK